ncbi:fumarylacetoacetate hydrolase family protein [Salibacteraceae bacterium]|jgi:acylpyruvate hydrolase|nr:fumarylacetoacetate hydrolase family protein [Salibacteraceae bacterium]MDB4105188.1 fumarylacetoacetate hydrolase family protein [Salibacteraceae bacterium]MDB9709008.1 fumarylacetoacetate hydrolase family protein [Salibacteraceae bacterium]MDC1305048.1 fumarylacetoacetate hydrolase family protein [Salibacteraceae bacterium]HAQ70927.1 2-hydroxyhepta-2,4-diene-1,7-dioate isomerase [Flavobacteriales bacterium]
MKIICIGRNYADHAKEMKSEVPTEPVFFLKPDTALLPKRNPFFIPSFSNDVHHELELVVRISRVGKSIEERFAHRYYNEVSVGIDFTARDIQALCKSKGLPWEKAKAFDGSAPVGKFVILKDDQNIQDLDITLKINDQIVQEVNTSKMIFSVTQIISYVSQFITLKIGDLIFTGTPAGVGPVKINDKLEGFIGEESLLKLNVK